MNAVVRWEGRGHVEARRGMAAGTTLARAALVALVATVGACGSGPVPDRSGTGEAVKAAPPPAPAATEGPTSPLPPNELGMIPVLEYHLIQDRVFDQFERPPARFRQDLEELYRRGYRPVNLSDVLDRKIQALPRGISPVVVTFDDSPPSQFSYLGQPGRIDPRSAIGIWLDFQKDHPGWGDRAVFCLLPNAQAGHAFFGNKGIGGQETAWRFLKVKWLADRGFELCDHTLWHARLDRYPNAVVQEQLARGQLAIDSAVSGYQVRTMALPLGMWPRDRALAWQGSWTDPRSKRTVRYHFDAVLEVAGSPNVNPYLPDFDPHRIHRQIMSGNGLEATLKRLDKPGPGGRYISDGDPATVARPPALAEAAAAVTPPGRVPAERQKPAPRRPAHQ